MHYYFGLSSPFERFIPVRLVIEDCTAGTPFELQLPAWRPGRYELGNFAKNIRGFKVSDPGGNNIRFEKVNKDLWRIHPLKSGNIEVNYEYYAVQPDAGGCYLDHAQLYVNPVHCCFFIPRRETMPVKITLNVPSNWQTATGMKKISEHQFEVPDADTLFDSPFIASPTLQKAGYVMDGIHFNIALQGDCNPDWPKIIGDFEAFTRVQLDMMKEFPASDFHFIVQVLPYKFYHGVEHLNSTVLALGPGYELMKTEMYNDFLGVASHELFHCWNVKSIRPVEMMPYDFTRENYSGTGYVYEGVTTYYGDLFLGRSGFFTLQQLLDELSQRLQKHMDNPGRFNYSVAESSFDTWLDGYTPGVPGRKTSIYDEGCLLAWILDFMIRSSTDSKKSLDEVMQVLYFDFAKKGKGYSGDDYRTTAELVAGRSFESFFREFVLSACSLENLLSEIISLAGLKMEVVKHSNRCERQTGMKTEFRQGNLFVTSVHPGSPASAAGIVKDDELIAIAGTRIENNLNELFQFVSSGNPTVELTIASGKKLRTAALAISESGFFSKYKIVSDDQLTHSQLAFRQSWLKK